MALVLSGCSLFYGPRNGMLSMNVDSRYTCNNDFTVTQLSTGKIVSGHGATYAPKHNFKDSVVIQHEMGISDTVFIDLRHRRDYVEVKLKPNQYFLDSIAKLEELIESKIAKIKDCDLSSDENKTNVTKSTVVEFDVQAVYPGGSEALVNDMRSAMHFPKIAEEMGISGKVFLKFVVDTEGMVKCVQIARGIPDCEECGREALIGLSNLKPFTPAMLNGVPVRTYYTLPVSFNLR